MSSEKEMYAAVAQAAFANSLPESQFDQDALLAAKLNQSQGNTSQESTSSSESTSQTTSAEASAETSANESAPNVKSFEDYIAERTGGKHKSWEEIESLINKPAENSFKYNSEIAEKVDKYIASGGKIDENWFKLQTKDYSTIDNPIELFRERMKIENPELSEVEIEYELNERYKLDQWEDDDETPLQQAMSAKIAREAKQALDFLTDYQSKSSIFKGKTPEQVEAEQTAMAQMEESAKAARNQFSEEVRATVTEIEKLKFTPIEGFEIDYNLSADEKNAVADVVASLYDGSTKLLEPYLKRSGDQITGVDIKGLATKLAKAEIFDNVIKKIAQESKAAGAANVVKTQKNINFTTESKSTNDTKPMDTNSVIANYFANKLK
jgi:hypothetical protein